MDASDVTAAVLGVLEEVQTLCGRPFPKLYPSSKPIGALEGFDSLAAMEATVLIEEKLGCGVEIDTLFVSDDGKRALTLDEICIRLTSRIEGVGE